MIAFGCAVTRPEIFRTCAKPGIALAAEPDSRVLELPATGSIFESYNALMDQAAACDDLEALVLVHQDAEIVDADFCHKLRAALRDPEVGIVGCVGAVGVRSIAWWEGSVALASFLHRYDDHGGGDLAAFSWAWSEAPPYARTGEVDSLDGFLLGLSPWAVRSLRFDTSLGLLHGYDFDFCLQVRDAGRKVVTADFRAIHHHGLMPFNDPEAWVEAHARVARKWDGRLGVGAAAGTWPERVRLAEAERDAARVQTYGITLEQNAALAEIERELELARASISWRLARLARRWRRHSAPVATSSRPRPTRVMGAHGISEPSAPAKRGPRPPALNGSVAPAARRRWMRRARERVPERPAP